MATCGYVCPSCEGRMFMQDGSVCTWCEPTGNPSLKASELTDEEWIQSVHSGPCCSDPGKFEPACDAGIVIKFPGNG